MHLPTHQPSGFSLLGQCRALDAVMVTSVPDTTCRHRLLRVTTSRWSLLCLLGTQVGSDQTSRGYSPSPHLGSNEVTFP